MVQTPRRQIFDLESNDIAPAVVIQVEQQIWLLEAQFTAASKMSHAIFKPFVP